MASEDFQVNDLVWAKMKGYPPWPAKIAKPLSNAKPPKNKKAQFVYFFGAKNFAWILDENITPHSESILNNLGNKKSAPYQRAIEELLTFSKSSQKDKQNSARNVEATISIKDENIDEEKKDIIPKKEIVPKKEKESPKKEKDVIPKKEKGREGSLRKSGNSVKKCQEKRVSTSSKSSKKVTRKRPLDVKVKEEPGECTSPKNQKPMLSDDPLVGSTPPYFLNSSIDNISVWEDDSVSRSDSYVTDDPGHYTIVRRKHVSPTMKKIGFIGLGNIGRAVVHNLLRSGHDVTVWNKTTYKCEAFVGLGAKKAQSPADIIVACDVTFCSVSDPDASKAIIFGDRGILKGLEQAEKLCMLGKGYVEMTSIDPETSKEIDEVIVRKGGKYLEAPICGNSINAAEGTLFILASGARDLFLQCETCFHAMGKHAYFVSCDVGFGSKMSLLLSMFSGTVYAAVAEALILAKRLGLEEEKFLKFLDLGPLQCQNLIEKSRRMMKREFKTVTPLKHVQKVLNLTLSLGNQYSQPMPVTAAANEVYKHARLLQYSDFDVSAVYQGVHY